MWCEADREGPKANTGATYTQCATDEFCPCFDCRLHSTPYALQAQEFYRRSLRTALGGNLGVAAATSDGLGITVQRRGKQAGQAWGSQLVQNAAHPRRLVAEAAENASHGRCATPESRVAARTAVAPPIR